MVKSLCIEKLFTEVDFYERFEQAANAGFTHVEFWSWSTKDLQRVEDELARWHLSVASISGDQEYSLIRADEREAYLDYLRRSMEAAKRLGCPTLVIHSDAIGPDGRIAPAAQSLTDDEKFDSAAQTLRLAGRIAEEEGVGLVLEALNTNTQPGCYLHDSATCARLVRQAASPRVRMLYDVWHMEQMEGRIPETIASLGDLIGYVHIADSNGRHEPGTGGIDFDAFKAALAGIGYDGTLGFELVPSSDSWHACEILRAF